MSGNSGLYLLACDNSIKSEPVGADDEAQFAREHAHRNEDHLLADHYTKFRQELQEWREKDRAQFPEKYEIERLTGELRRLDEELQEHKAREAQEAESRRATGQTLLFLAIYGGGAAVIYRVFQDANPGRAWNGTETATWWDALSMIVWLGWSLGGPFLCWAAAKTVKPWWRKPRH